jgi:hypothetical protein
MEYRTEPLVAPGEAILPAVLLAIVLGLVLIVYLLTRASTKSRIRASDPGQVIRWWMLPAAIWIAILVAGDLLLTSLGRLGSWPAAIGLGVLILAVVLVPCATLFATLLWMWPRLRGTR